ncbi:hypothetical protein [Thiomonas sp.]
MHGDPDSMDAFAALLSGERRAAPSFPVHLAACKPLGFGSVQAAAGQPGAAGLIPLGGPDANAAGLGALSRKRRAAPSFLDPLGGPDANAAGLGALTHTRWGRWRSVPGGGAALAGNLRCSAAPAGCDGGWH